VDDFTPHIWIPYHGPKPHTDCRSRFAAALAKFKNSGEKVEDARRQKSHSVIKSLVRRGLV
jgi:hypothetical protein